MVWSPVMVHRSTEVTHTLIIMLKCWWIDWRPRCVSQGPRQVFAGNWFLPPPSNFSCSSSTQEHSCPCMTVSHTWNLIYSNQLNKCGSSFILTKSFMETASSWDWLFSLRLIYAFPHTQVQCCWINCTLTRAVEWTTLLTTWPRRERDGETTSVCARQSS